MGKHTQWVKHKHIKKKPIFLNSYNAIITKKANWMLICVKLHNVQVIQFPMSFVKVSSQRLPVG